MKNTLLITLTLLIFSCKVPLAKRTIKLNIQSTSEYCEGAKPTEEILADYNTPKPYTGSIYLHQDPDRNDAGIAVIFSNGKAEVSGLVEGDYLMFEYPKADFEKFKQNPTISADQIHCAVLRSQQMLGDFSVDEKTKEVTQQIKLACDPCSEPKP